MWQRDPSSRTGPGWLTTHRLDNVRVGKLGRPALLISIAALSFSPLLFLYLITPAFSPAALALPHPSYSRLARFLFALFSQAKRLSMRTTTITLLLFSLLAAALQASAGCWYVDNNFVRLPCGDMPRASSRCTIARLVLRRWSMTDDAADRPCTIIAAAAKVKRDVRVIGFEKRVPKDVLERLR